MPTNRWRTYTGVIAAAVAAAALLQTQLGVSAREFTSDDSGHFGTMAVLRGLALGGHVLDPLRYFIGYYEHYQVLGLGLWPPAYHMLGAAWTTVFGISRTSVMAFQAVLAGGLAGAAALAGWRPLGPGLAVAAGAGVLLSPLMLAGLSLLQADVPTALAMFLAALAFWRLLDRGRLRDGLLFGAVALVAIMVKGNAIALALLPPLAVLLSGRWGLLRRPGFWVPAAVILPVAGPWYVLTYSWTSAGFRYAFGPAYTAVAAPFVAGQFLHVFGPVLLVLAAAGLLRRRGDVFTAVMLALVLANVLFQAIVPAALEPRYLLPSVAPMLLLAARGALLAAAAAVRAAPSAMRLAPLAGLAAGAVIPLLTNPPDLPVGIGARAAATEALRHLPSVDPVVLIASDAPGEGAISVEMIMHEGVSPRMIPRMTAVRGSRLLGGGGYNNFEYRPRYPSPEAAMAQVERLRIPMILLDRSSAAGRWAHVGQLAAMLDRPGGGWDRAAQVAADGRTWDLFLRRADGTTTDLAALAPLLRPNKGPRVE